MRGLHRDSTTASIATSCSSAPKARVGAFNLRRGGSGPFPALLSTSQESVAHLQIDGRRDAPGNVKNVIQFVNSQHDPSPSFVCEEGLKFLCGSKRQAAWIPRPRRRKPMQSEAAVDCAGRE